MNWSSLCLLAAAGMLITGFAATASKALQDFSRRELEIYSRRRRKTDRFGSILDGYEQADLALESLQIIGTAVLVLSFLALVSKSLGGFAEISAVQFAAIVAVSARALLAVTTWIPEAVISLWTAPFVYHSWPLLQLIT